MAGTIDSAIEKKRDEDPATLAKKQRKAKSDADRPEPTERNRPRESRPEMPETD